MLPSRRRLLLCRSPMEQKADTKTIITKTKQKKVGIAYILLRSRTTGRKFLFARGDCSVAGVFAFGGIENIRRRRSLQLSGRADFIARNLKAMRVHEEHIEQK